MEYSIIIRPQALDDLKEIIEWYGKENIELSIDFLQKFGEAVRRIENNPLQFATIHKDFRKLNTERFPYKIIYRIDADDIIVLGIIHHKRHERVWKKRK